MSVHTPSAGTSPPRLSHYLDRRRRGDPSLSPHNFKLPSAVTFCGIQIEIAEGEPDLDIHFNRGKSLEDVFDNLTLSQVPAKTPEEAMERKKKNRGRREMGEVTVQTFTNFEEGASALDKVPDVEASAEAETCSTPSSSKASTKESTPANPDQINFVSGNPFVEVTKGVLHLYKENQTTSLEEGVIRSQMMCMLGVPAKIKTPDLLQFTAPCHSGLELMRIIQDNSPNQYMVLLSFRCQEAADEFYQAFNGQRFNSFEDDVCSLVYVSKVETCKESEFFPLGGHTELPVCSICLERMDESISTVLTILCNHTFHGSCLAQWEDSTCPVCRCFQTPEVIAEQKCSECQSSEDLWICLVCGYVGCGRYVGGHSHAHFMDTQHCYTMEMGQNRVWDYVGDNFVHRLVQTDSADGKMVEAEGNGVESDVKCIDGVNVDSDAKMDSIQLEYTYLLTSQLEAQRRYFEEKIARLEEQTNLEIDEMRSRTKTSVEESKQMEEKLGAVSKEKGKIEQKLTQVNSRLNKLNSDLKEEKQMNESLRRNQKEWQVRFKVLEAKSKSAEEEKNKEIQNLQEQVRDLMFYLEAQQTVAQSPLKEEIKEGDVIVGAAAPTPAQVLKSRTRRKK